MFVIREIESRDIEEILQLAKLLNMINLPKERVALEEKVNRSVRSFKGKVEDPFSREFIFVLKDLERDKIVGCSLILAKHGDEEEPHTFFSVLEKRKESQSLHIGFLHKVLRVGFNTDGPSEIGALVVSPEYRGHPEKLGKFLSYSRFMYMKARREYFCDEVLCELMPPFNSRGEAPIWEEIGRKFTNLSYIEADKLSRKNKEFITSLYPEGDIYTCMLSAEAREAIGRVGKSTLPVKKMLESIGFEYRNMIDPFDGGPHYWAKTDDIAPLKETRKIKFLIDKGLSKDLKQVHGSLMCFTSRGVRFVKGAFAFRSDSEVLLEESLVERLTLSQENEVYFLNF